MDKNAFSKIASSHKELKLLLLFGSRATGKARDDSDWDFGYIASGEFDDSALYTELVLSLGTDKVDLVDLSRANGLLRYRVAKDNVLLYQKDSQEYEKFWLQAVHFWCDAGPIIRNEYNQILKELDGI